MNAMYSKGRSYCFKLNRTLYKDILHDAFLNWFTKTGRNLFEEPERRVIRVLKLTWLGYYVNVNQRKRHFVEVDDEIHSVNKITPEHLLVAKETGEWFNSKMKAFGEKYPRTAENVRQVYELKRDGYEQQEIAEILGIAKSSVTYYVKNFLKELNGN